MNSWKLKFLRFGGVLRQLCCGITALKPGITERLLYPTRLFARGQVWLSPTSYQLHPHLEKRDGLSFNALPPGSPEQGFQRTVMSDPFFPSHRKRYFVKYSTSKLLVERN